MSALSPPWPPALGWSIWLTRTQRGTLASSAIAPHALGHRLNAALRIDHNDTGLDWQQRGAGLVGEHVKAGRIDEVDFYALPLGKGDGVLHGHAAGDFFFVIGGDGRAVGHAALGGSHFGGMQQRGNQCGFAAVRMPHYSYVADLTSLVRFHNVSLHLRWGRRLRQARAGNKARELVLCDWICGVLRRMFPVICSDWRTGKPQLWCEREASVCPTAGGRIVRLGGRVCRLPHP